MGAFNSDREAFVFGDWTVFRKFLDGTYARLYFVFEDGETMYRVVTEPYGGTKYECGVVKDGGAAQLDFETNFKDLEPRVPGLAGRSGSTTVDRRVYDLSSATVNYIGYARKVGTTADLIWHIKRLTFSAGGDLEETAWSSPDVAWDNRTSETYS
jgi:hypothetical protein